MRHIKPSLQCKSNSSRRTHFNPENHAFSPRLGICLSSCTSPFFPSGMSLSQRLTILHISISITQSALSTPTSLRLFPAETEGPEFWEKRERTSPGATRDVDKKSGKKSQRIWETAPSWRNKVRPKRIDATLRGDAADRQTTQGQLKTYCGIVRRAASPEWMRACAPRVNHMVRLTRKWRLTSKGSETKSPAAWRLWAMLAWRAFPLSMMACKGNR